MKKMILADLGVSSEGWEKASDNVQGHHERRPQRVQSKKYFELKDCSESIAKPLVPAQVDAQSPRCSVEPRKARVLHW